MCICVRTWSEGKLDDMVSFGVFGYGGDMAPAKEERVREAMRQRRMQYCIE